MNDNAIQLSTVIAAALWVWVLGVLITAWILLAVGHWQVAALCGLTACASSAVAATAQIRCYALRICSSIRAGREMRPIR